MGIGPNLLRKCPPWEADKKGGGDKTHPLIGVKEYELNRSASGCGQKSAECSLQS
jgi:hypothetical protein